jgi:hypothetical protein
MSHTLACYVDNGHLSLPACTISPSNACWAGSLSQLPNSCPVAAPTPGDTCNPPLADAAAAAAAAGGFCPADPAAALAVATLLPGLAPTLLLLLLLPAAAPSAAAAAATSRADVSGSCLKLPPALLTPGRLSGLPVRLLLRASLSPPPADLLLPAVTAVLLLVTLTPGHACEVPGAGVLLRGEPRDVGGCELPADGLLPS